MIYNWVGFGNQPIAYKIGTKVDMFISLLELKFLQLIN